MGKTNRRSSNSRFHVDDYQAKLGSVIEGIDSRLGPNELRRLFPENPRIFKNPKPSTLIRELLSFATDEDSIILDSFAGSGTTAHAVLAPNRQDGGNRRFILIECEDYADSLTAERVRRVMDGVPDVKDGALNAGFGGAFSYYELGPPMLEGVLLEGEKLPSYEALGNYIFFTATGEEVTPEELDRARCFLGRAGNSDFFLIYEPDAVRLRDLALDMDFARSLPAPNGRKRIVYAPARYLDEEFLDHYSIKFCQLPFEIYRMLADA